MPADEFVVTAELRFVTRVSGTSNSNVNPVLRILQQLWKRVSHDGSGAVSFEWRDVPLVQEDRPSLQNPDVDTITLSEAATKAWKRLPASLQQQEIKDPTNAHERTARFDVSLANQLQRSMERNAELAGLLQSSIAANEAMLEKIKRIEADNKRLEYDRDAYLARLPDGMKGCTILFEECPKGHGSLRGANWVKPECQACRIQKQQDALRWIVQQAQLAHRYNIQCVAEEGLKP